MKQPNVLIIHADQQRYDSLGCCGNNFAITPNIDRLARMGTVFDRHISANPVCMPSRASLLTGLYPPGHNVYTNGVALNRRDYLNVNDLYGTDYVKEPVTMADMFADAGYHTASFGKLHLTPNVSPREYGYQECWELMEDGSLDDWHGPYYGFDYVDMTLGHGEQPCHGGHYGAWLKKNHPDLYETVKDNEANGPKPIQGVPLYPSPVPADLHNTTWLANRFSAYLENERPKDKPFFTFIGFPDPHHPFNPSYDILDKFLDIEVKTPYDPDGKALENCPGLAKFAGGSVADLSDEQRKLIIRYTYAMVYQVDMAVGKILDALDNAGLTDDTIIIFTSDHGDFLCDHQKLYKGEVGSDALLHVPFILKPSKGMDLTERNNIPMSNCDVMPTLAALSGVEIPEGLHGVNIIEKMKNNETHYALAFCAKGEPESVNYTVYDNSYRLTWYPQSNFIELFNHDNDPGEVVNIADVPEETSTVERLLEVIKDKAIRYNNPILAKVGLW
jgi:arylsulfatase A-like enzyme